MPRDYPFPDDVRNPNRTGPNPFAGEDPHLDPPHDLTDGQATGEAEDGNDLATMYGASQRGEEYAPEYEACVRDRVTLCLICAAFGVVGSLIGWLAVLRPWMFGPLYLMPPFSLAGSLPAWSLASSDLRAMKWGAMDRKRRRAARVAAGLGALGTINSAIFIARAIWTWLPDVWWVWWVWW